MFLGLGVASLAAGAVRGLAQLVANKPSSGAANPFQIDSSATSVKTQQANPANTTALSSGTISPATMTSLLEAQSNQPSQADQTSMLNGLFRKLDSDASGSVSEAEFVASLGAGGPNAASAKAVFGAVDKNSDGIVTMDEMSTGMRKSDGEMSLASSRAIASYLKMENVAAQARTASTFDYSTGAAL